MSAGGRWGRGRRARADPPEPARRRHPRRPESESSDGDLRRAARAAGEAPGEGVLGFATSLGPRAEVQSVLTPRPRRSLANRDLLPRRPPHGWNNSWGPWYHGPSHDGNWSNDWDPTRPARRPTTTRPWLARLGVNVGGVDDPVLYGQPRRPAGRRPWPASDDGDRDDDDDDDDDDPWSKADGNVTGPVEDPFLDDVAKRVRRRRRRRRHAAAALSACRFPARGRGLRGRGFLPPAVSLAHARLWHGLPHTHRPPVSRSHTRTAAAAAAAAAGPVDAGGRDGGRQGARAGLRRHDRDR